MREHNFSRRTFLGMVAVTPLALRPGPPGSIPIGLELYSVRDGLQKDLAGTLQAVAKMGYECVEFYAPYYGWRPDYARQVRNQLDHLGLRCYSTHNDSAAFAPDGIDKAIKLNEILGARYIVLADPGEVQGVEGWKQVSDRLNKANESFAKEGLHSGYHNHDVEWKPVEGQKPIEVLAANTDKSIMLQLDVGTCLETHNDPVAWIEKNPGRIRSLHLKDWSPGKGYRVLFGEGVAPWTRIFKAAEATGGVEYYLIEQEGSEYSELETAQRCLAAYQKLRTSSGASA